MRIVAGSRRETVGVTRQTINAIELGKYSPSLEVAFLIARALSAELEDVFSYPDDAGADAGAGPSAKGGSRS